MKLPQVPKHLQTVDFIFVSIVCCLVGSLIFLTPTGVKDADAKDIGAFIPGQGWVKHQGSCDGDSTPLQFIPKTGVDVSPLTDELKKYPRCVHCGMSRMMWHHSRHLVHYDDDLAVGTCSIRCLAVNLSLNLDRGIKMIWAADYGDKGQPKKLVNVDAAAYLIGSNLKGTMTRNSKMAFSSKDQASALSANQGGTLASFEKALSDAYHDMARDTVMIRKRRAEKQKKMMKTKE